MEGNMIKGELFSTDMVKAFLEGRKSRTSRPVKPQPAEIEGCSHVFIRDDFEGEAFTGFVCRNCGYGVSFPHSKYPVGTSFLHPKYKPGDVMYVRETFYQYGEWYDTEKRVQINGEWETVAKHTFVAKQGFPVYFKNTLPGNIEVKHAYKDGLGYYKRPSLFMPFEAARLFFRVTDVKVQNLKELTNEDAEQDGFISDVEPLLLDSPDYKGSYAYDRFMEFWRDTYGTDARWMWVYYLTPISKEEALKA